MGREVARTASRKKTGTCDAPVMLTPRQWWVPSQMHRGAAQENVAPRPHAPHDQIEKKLKSNRKERPHHHLADTARKNSTCSLVG